MIRRRLFTFLLCIVVCLSLTGTAYCASTTVQRTAKPHKYQYIDSKYYFPSGNKGKKAKEKFAKDRMKDVYTFKKLPTKKKNGKTIIDKSKLSKSYIYTNTKVKYSDLSGVMQTIVRHNRIVKSFSVSKDGKSLTVKYYNYRFFTSAGLDYTVESYVKWNSWVTYKL